MTSKPLRLLTISLATLLLMLSSLAATAAGVMPKSWPWIGVTVNNLTFTPAELIALKAQIPRMNSIRLTLLARQTADMKKLPPDAAWADMSLWANSMLDVCAKYNIAAIITVHQFPVDPAKGFDQTSPKFWSDAAERANAIAYVDRMAKDFASRGDELAAFEVLSEPLVKKNNRQVVPDEWPALMSEIVTTIRKYSNKWIVVTPGLGGIPSGYVGFTPLNDNHIVYGTHMYEPWAFTLQGLGAGLPLGPTYPGKSCGTPLNKAQIANTFKPLRNFQTKYQVPVWVGEFSATRWGRGSNEYLLDVINLSNSYGWGWAYFNMGGFHAWDPDFDSNFPSPTTPLTRVGHSSDRWKMLNSVLGP